MKAPAPSPRRTGLLLATVAGLSFWVGVQHLRIAAQTKRTTALLAEFEAARQRVRDAEARLAEIHSRPMIGSAAPSAAAIPSPAGPETSPPLPEALLDNPALQTLLATATKGALDGPYGLLFRQLDLDPGRQDRLKELLTERRMNALDLLRAAQAQGLDATGTDALLAASGAEIDTNIRFLLGQPGYERFQNYEKHLGAYRVLADLERRLGPHNAPLSEAQSEAVLRLLAEGPAATKPARAADDPLSRIQQAMGGDVSPSPRAGSARPLITGQTLEAARTILNESQLEALRELQAGQPAQPDAAESELDTGGRR